MLLQDKVVIVTGVGPGMGRKLALIAAAEGAKVAVSARTKSFVDGVVEEIQQAGGAAIAVSTDVADMAQCENLARATLDAFGRIDGLVNSARAHGPFITFEDGDLDEWAANMQVTCFGALRMVKAVLPAMKRQGGGAIVNVSTMAALKPMTGEADYATAKGALTTATRQLANELGQYNIRVNCTRMGWMWGAPVQGYVRGQAKALGVPEAEVIAPIAKRIALGVIPPDEECAKSVLFFVSDYSKVVTGASLDVNGGEYMAP
ncbi:MAG TPA: SDR family oxidoreductase [Alphaproteobacteria bacterium]|nr:SDR family oxidoreductase [Alphaproteobacteria bacterium]